MQFPLRLDIRIDWSEMDLFCHVNNVMFFKYVQASRVNYWEAMGMNRLITEKRIGPILASTACQFLKQLHFPGNIVVQCRMEFIKNTSFGFHHQVLNDKGELVAEAHDVMVMFDFNRNEKMPLPEEIRKKVEEIENSALT